MITEKELVEAVEKLKEKIWLHTHPMVKGITDTKLWGEVYSKLEEIVGILHMKGIKITK